MTINLHNVLRNFLFILIALYFTQGSLYATESIIAKSSLLFILLISSFYLIKSLLISNKKGVFYYTWMALLFLNVVGFIINGSFSGAYFSQIKKILTALLPFFPFYYFAYKGFLVKEHLLRFFIVLLPIAVAGYYSSRNDILLESLNNIENVVTNKAYFFVVLIPYVFLLGKRKIFSISVLLLLLFFIIQSAKRGALITGIIGSLVFIYYQLTTINPKRRVPSFILSLAGVFLLIWFSYDFYISNDFLINRIQKIDEGGSGRDVIYSNLFSNWFESDSVVNFLFGFGFVSTIKYSGTGNLAHNDWLELLTNFGLLGICIYLSVFGAAIRFVFYSKVEREDRLMMVAIILTWFLQTLFSMYYTVSTTVLTSILLGYLFGNYQRNRSVKNRFIAFSKTISQGDN